MASYLLRRMKSVFAGVVDSPLVLRDLFHEDIPDAFLDQVMDVIRHTPHHTYQILTKRADRLPVYFAHRECPPPYRYDYTEAQHLRLLQLLVELPCKVMVSGYRSDMYEQWLGDWRTFSFPVRTRSGEWAEEWVWMNYPETDALHDYRYLGESFRERERIRRMIERWKSRLSELPRWSARRCWRPCGPRDKRQLLEGRHFTH